MRKPYTKPTISRYEFLDGSIFAIKVIPSPSGVPGTAIVVYDLIRAHCRRAGIDKLEVKATN